MTPRDDLVSRLRDAHANSQQRIFGSNIFEEAASALEGKNAEIAEWRQAASVEAGLRREFLARAEAAESRIAILERQLAEETERCARVAEATTVSSSGHPQIDAPTPYDMRRAIAAAIRGGAKP
jgi:hypothetical protein